MKKSSLVIKDLQPSSWGKLQNLSVDELSAVKGGLIIRPIGPIGPIGCIGIWLTF